MKTSVTLAAGAALIAACWALAPPARAEEVVAGGGATFAGAEQAEALLRAANLPFRTRADLVPRQFPEGCVWLAAYTSDDAGVILETFAFMDVVGAENYVTNRNADFDAMDVKREHLIVNNGSLVLVAWFNETGDDQRDARACGVMNEFAAAFVK
jgi:hypothetical protein